MIIRNGRIVNEKDIFISDIRVENSIITEVGKSLSKHQAEEEFDAKDYYILPGAIDVHTHFDMPFKDIKTSDDFYTGTRAAIKGGTTTIIDFAESTDIKNLEQGILQWHKKAKGKSYCDYSFHMTVSCFNKDIEKQIEKLVKQGITSFKAYTAYKDSIGLYDYDLLKLMDCIAKNKAILCVHCENDDMMNHFESFRQLPNFDLRNHPLSRNNIVEKSAISRIIDMAEFTGAEIYIVHVSTKEGVFEIKNAKARNLKIYAETCPQYLLLDETKYELENFESAKYIMSPPLRSKADIKILWDAIAEDTLDTVSTDHCSFNFQTKKQLGIDDYRKVPNGIPGVEHRLELMIHNFKEHNLELTDVVKFCATNPAKIFGLYPKKGSLIPGSDADIVLVKQENFKISSETQLQEVDYTPFEAMELSFKVNHVIKSGHWIIKNGKFITTEPTGIFIRRNRINLLNK